ncbi:WD40 repeat-like protein [Tothia fuscella]|uniref:WD40 repeat-like protein n=1 Tax=Tothia fuscella TaxID=1048955 RepID=A0A9P4NLQ5_9PEZI|nr:WD40 repeat-like protein [Tothia fuscella]
MKTYQATASSNLGLPADSYIYSFATTAIQEDTRTDVFKPLKPSDRLAGISSDDSIRVFDPSTLKILPDGLFTNAHKGITSIKRFAPNGQESNILMTSGRDGVVRGWDLRSKSKVLELQTPKGEPLSMLDCNAGLNAIVAGKELEADGPGDVSIFGWDIRNPGTIKLHYAESHTDTITELRFIQHDQSISLLLSASTDGLINIFDTAITEEEDAVFQIINHRSALHHAGRYDNGFYALGTDETFSLYPFQNPDFDAEEPKPIHLGDVREKLGCEYVWLNLIPFGTDTISTLSSVEGENKIESAVQLKGAHGEELVRDLFIAEGASVVFTCGEDGMVRQWKNAGDEDVEMSGTKRRRDGGSGGKGKRSKGS